MPKPERCNRYCVRTHTCVSARRRLTYAILGQPPLSTSQPFARLRGMDTMIELRTRGQGFLKANALGKARDKAHAPTLGTQPEIHVTCGGAWPANMTMKCCMHTSQRRIPTSGHRLAECKVITEIALFLRIRKARARVTATRKATRRNGVWRVARHHCRFTRFQNTPATQNHVDAPTALYEGMRAPPPPHTQTHHRRITRS